jgi:hypothetical protein
MSAPEVRWVYPLNWDGLYDPQTRGWKRMKVRLLHFDEEANGTTETDALKIDRSSMLGANGMPCYKICIEKIEYQTYGVGLILEYDMTPDQLICVIPEGEAGVIHGPFLPEITEPGGYLAGETGNVVLTSQNSSQYDSYDLLLHIRIKEQPTFARIAG